MFAIMISVSDCVTANGTAGVTDLITRKRGN